MLAPNLGRIMSLRALQQGFSLLEVLVAFAILALSLGVLMQIFSAALTATAISGDYFRAAAVAEARLNAVGVDIPLSPGTYSGEPEDGIDWVVHIEPYQGAGDAANPLALTPYQVSAVATWPGTGAGRGRRVLLETLRLGSTD